MIRTIVFEGLYRGPLILGNYLMELKLDEDRYLVLLRIDQLFFSPDGHQMLQSSRDKL